MFLPFKVKISISSGLIDSVEMEKASNFHWEIFSPIRDASLESKIHKWMEAYALKKQSNIQLSLNTKQFPAFTQTVWKALCKIPFGTTITYKELAKLSGNADASRAVGNACGKNPCLLFIPCHRVVASDGSLGGFYAGLNIKKSLIQYESS